MAIQQKTRPVSWVKAARKEFEKFPDEAKSICLAALTIAAEGGKAGERGGLGAAGWEDVEDGEVALRIGRAMQRNLGVWELGRADGGTCV